MKLISITIFIFLSACYGRNPETTGMEGKPLPSFNLLLPDSTTRIDTKNIQSGKPVVLFLFGPRCPYSKLQIEDIIDNIARLNHIQFYLITPYSYALMKQFYQEYQLHKYANIKVGVDTQNFFSPYIGARGVPFIAIYDKNKILNKAFIGKISSSLIKEITDN